MELFLNLCWLTLALPAYLLWRQRVSTNPWSRASLVIICTLGCALVLLFPVVSASDDLHAVAQTMEESKRAMHSDGSCCRSHAAVDHAVLFALPASGQLNIVVAQVGTVVPLTSTSLELHLVAISDGRAPPSLSLVSL
jgi:hypothetical protein